MSNKSLDGVLTKKAHVRESFTEDQIETLQKCIKNMPDICANIRPDIRYPEIWVTGG